MRKFDMFITAVCVLFLVTPCLLGVPGGGGTPLQEPNGDVPLDGVAFSQLE